ncbi:MAG TPA: TadA family conjugal transfer-associated ATPase [Candidatus Limnocylindria bacterium]|nr:TadA family conjugal transfer-associated ATPase [Candidatus Limnocylindria bacterium]
MVGRVRDRLLEDGGSTSPTSSRLAAAVRAEGRVLGDQAILATLGVLRAELEGAGPLSALLTDPSVTDILVNGPDEVWVDQGAGLIRTGVRFTSEAAVRQLAQRLAATAGRRLDDASPWCDLRLPAGVRLHAVLPPVSRHGTVLSLRVPARRPWTVDELERSGTLGPIGRQLLVDLVDARRSFLVSGGTGTGKTTVLATLLGLVAHDERIVLVEDLPELVPDHPHVVSLVGRPANIEGAGEVTVRDLVRQALRMRPDRLVVGECRGAEVVDLLAALNTGHQGGCGTVHANSAVDVPTRLEALGVAAGLSREALHAQLASAVDVVLHLERSASGARVLTEVAVLERDRDGLVVARPALVRESGDLHEAAHATRLADRLAGAGR